MNHTALLQCTGCSHQWTVREGEIAADDYPLCPHCYMPGVLIDVEVREVEA